jgi:hypothetical protein
MPGSHGQRIAIVDRALPRLPVYLQRRTAVSGTYDMSVTTSSAGAMHSCPPRSRSSSGQTSGGASKRSGQKNSTCPSGPTSARLCPSPVAARSPMRGYGVGWAVTAWSLRRHRRQP